MTVSKLVSDFILAGRSIDEVETTEIFPRSDWVYDVECDYTSASYHGWLESKIEQEVDDVTAGIERLFHAGPRLFMGDLDQKGMAEAVEEAFTAFRALDDETATQAMRILGCEERPLLFGETCRNLPEPVVADLGRIAHLAMVAFEGRCDQETIDLAIHQFGLTHGIENDEISAARMRQGIDDGESPQGPV